VVENERFPLGLCLWCFARDPALIELKGRDAKRMVGGYKVQIGNSGSITAARPGLDLVLLAEVE